MVNRQVDPKRDEGLKVKVFNISAGFNRTKPEFDGWGDEHTFYRSNISFSGIIVDGRNTFLPLASLTFLGDDEIFSERAPIGAGGLIYQKRTSENFSYTVGGVFTYVFGGGTVVPILGLQIGNRRTNSFRLMLPVSMIYSSATNKKFFYEIALKPQGGISHFSNEQDFSDQPEELVFRSRAIKLAVVPNYRVGKNMTLRLELAALGLRRISLNDDTSSVRDDSFWERDVDGTLSLNLQIRYRIRRKSDSLPFFMDDFNNLF